MHERRLMLMKEIKSLLSAVNALLDSEDNTGCSEDLTVVSYTAVKKLRDEVNIAEENLPELRMK
jgi:hypothetical protein